MFMLKNIALSPALAAGASVAALREKKQALQEKDLFHKKNKSHSLAFNAGSPRVVANRPAPLAGRCGNLPAPLSRTARRSSIIAKKFCTSASLR